MRETSLILSNFNVVATLNGEPAIADAVGYTYNILINGVAKSTIILNGSVTPQTGSNATSFSINPGDNIVIQAVLNAGAKKADDPDDFTFEWCINYA